MSKENLEMGKLSYYSSSSNKEKNETHEYEKGFDQDVEVIDIEEGDIETTSNYQAFGYDRKALSHNLKQRQLQMMALVNTFGTGIFLSSGGILADSGPCGTFLCYLLVAFVVGFSQSAMAELAALYPITSCVQRHAEHFIDPAMGFSYGWMNVWSALMPGEISAAAVIVSYWSDLSQAIWISIIIVLIVTFNSFNVRYFGEIEFGFALIKLALLVGLIVTSIVITSGGAPNHKTIGFQYWRDPGPFVEYLTTGNLGKFAGFWKAINAVVYSYGGTQGVPSLAAEVENPRKTCFTACKRVFYRVAVLMCLAAFCLTLIVPSNNEQIANSTGNASSSPFVVAMKNANINVLPSIVNAAVLTSAFSAGNQVVLYGSRSIFALAVKGQAPKIFTKTNRWGVPWVSNLLMFAFLPLAYMNVSTSSANVFNWFQNLTSALTLVQWIVISANHVAMQRAMKAQGIPRSRLPHSLKFAPFGAYFSLFMSCLFLLTAGFPNFVKGNFEFSSFFSDYFVIPAGFVLYFLWKFLKKTRLLRPEEVDLEVLFKDAEDHPEPADPPVRGWRIVTLLWS